MRVFCHISEFRGDGPRSLPCLIFLSDRVSLWSPSAGLFDHERAAGRSYLGAFELLELIKLGHIQVMGRRKWLLHPEERESSDFRFAAWDERFDGAIAEIGLQEERECVPEIERKVRFIRPEAGWKWASAVLESDTNADVNRVQIAESLIAGRELPPAALEKIDMLPSKKSKQLMVLRDAKNHSDAMTKSCADLLAVLTQRASGLIQLFPNKFKPASSEDIPTSEELREAIDVLTHITKPRSIDDLVKLLERKDRRKLASELGGLVHRDAPIARILAADIAAGTRNTNWLGSLWPRTNFQRVMTGAGLIAGIATFALTGNPTLSFIIGMVGRTEGPLRKASIMPADSYGGPVLPIVLALGKRNPTYKQLEEIQSKLSKFKFK